MATTTTPTVKKSYSELLAEVQALAENDDTEFQAQFPNWLKNAEQMVVKAVDPMFYRVRATANFGADSTVGNNAFLRMPNDVVIMRDVYFFTPVGLSRTTGTRVGLDQKSEGFCYEYWGNLSNTGTPKYFAYTGSQEILVVPTPTEPYDVEMFYTKRPDTLTAASTFTDPGGNVFTGYSYLSVWYGDLLLYGLMVQACAFLKDYEASAYWKGLFDESTKGSAVEERRKKSEDRSDDSLSEPPEVKKT